MIFEPIEVRAEGSVLIAAQIEKVFKFISNPNSRLDVATPLEIDVKTRDESAAESGYHGELKIAGRVLHYEARTSLHEQPTRLVVEMEGDVTGKQVFDLTKEESATRLNMDLQYFVPPELPDYYREEPSRTRFAETFVSQTLANIQAALETESSS